MVRDISDSIETGDRILIKSLYAERGIVPTTGPFGCAAFTPCSQSHKSEGKFHTGTWAYVGVEYGQAQIAGFPIRVLFVGMDIGGKGGGDEELFEDAQKDCRKAAESPGNAHMGGVKCIFALLCNEQNPQQRSRQFALTNAVKCTKHTGSMTTYPTAAMIRNCAEHLREEIRCLRPHLVITQGPHPADTITKILSPLDVVAEYRGKPRGTAQVLRGANVVVLTTPHPARHKGLKWSQDILPEFFVDAIMCARQELITAVAPESWTGNRVR